MTKILWLLLITAVSTLMTLGFFGQLWHSVKNGLRNGLSLKRRWLPKMMLVFGFTVISQEDGCKWMACLLGFYLARGLITSRLALGTGEVTDAA